MGTEIYYKQLGFEQGLSDGKITQGKISKKYVENLFRSETQNLSNQESVLYKNGWQDGFAEAVRGDIKCMIEDEGCLKKQVNKFV